VGYLCRCSQSPGRGFPHSVVRQITALRCPLWRLCQCCVLCLQERMQTILHARIEELSEDMTASFKQQTAYQVQLEQKIDARFDKIEATMATKEDIAALEKRVLNVEQGIQQILQQLVTIALKLE
jgi:hypothetical protein